jgi:hypothetical protein
LRAVGADIVTIDLERNCYVRCDILMKVGKCRDLL